MGGLPWSGTFRGLLPDLKSISISRRPIYLIDGVVSVNNQHRDAQLIKCLTVYHQESLSLGFATKAIRCEAAYDWDISGKTLVWASKTGEIETQELSQHTKRPDSIEDRIKLEVSGHLVPENLAPHALLAGLRYVSLTEMGDIILQSSLRHRRGVGDDDKLWL